MEISYCDLCGSVMKENNYYSLYVAKPHEKDIDTSEDYVNYCSKVKREMKEICPSCYHVFNKMFDLRLHRLSELSEELNNIYNLKSKENPKDKKDGKKKK